MAPSSDSEIPALAHLRFCDPDVYWIHTELSPMREYFVRESSNTGPV
ncbi:MAG: hypothetical protein ACRC8S_14485 [Fimbriiglobus sp.]